MRGHIRTNCQINRLFCQVLFETFVYYSLVDLIASIEPFFKDFLVDLIARIANIEPLLKETLVLDLIASMEPLLKVMSLLIKFKFIARIECFKDVRTEDSVKAILILFNRSLNDLSIDGESPVDERKSIFKPYFVSERPSDICQCK